MILYELYRIALRQLKAAGVDTPELDARLLLEHATATTHLDLIVNQGMEIDAAKQEALEQALARRLGGESVHRIVGHRDFHGLRLLLSPGTLEPRPDTEVLVDLVAPHLKRLVAAGAGPRILDLGTGTGAIALALLDEVRAATAVGVDISVDALATAGENALLAGSGFRFEARLSNWFSDVSGKFHAIVSNPPYIRSDEIGTLSREVRDFDPLAALDGGVDGLDAYRVIAEGSASFLQPNGVVAVEIGHDQFDAVDRLFLDRGFERRETGVDLLGHRRAMLFSKP